MKKYLKIILNVRVNSKIGISEWDMAFSGVFVSTIHCKDMLFPAILSA